MRCICCRPILNWKHNVSGSMVTRKRVDVAETTNLENNLAVCELL